MRMVIVCGNNGAWGLDPTGAAEPTAQEKKYLTARQAAFIGVGAMGAGIFVLLGAQDGQELALLSQTMT